MYAIPNPPPNILFLLIDCLRADAINQLPKIAYLRSLASSGVTWDNMIASSNHTLNCTASILTGLYPRRHRVYTPVGAGILGRLDDKVSSLPELLATQGYHTYGFTTGPLLPETGLNRGFQEFHCRDVDHYLAGNWGQEFRKRLHNTEFKPPWFVFVHLWELHTPYDVLDLVDDPFESDHVLTRAARQLLRFQKVGKPGYLTSLRALDEQIRLLVSPIIDNTLVVIHGDHGEQLADWNLREQIRRLADRVRVKVGRVPSRFYAGHSHSLRDQVVRVPLILTGISGMDLPRSRVISAQVRQVDVAPTVLDLVSKSWPSSMDGVSLLPQVFGHSLEECPAMLEGLAFQPRASVEDRWLFGVRYEGWKFLYTPRGQQRNEQLYDLSRDPEELINVATAFPERVAALRQMAESFLNSRLNLDTTGTLSKQEEEAVMRRLKDLGYL